MGLSESCPFLEETTGTIKSVAQGLLHSVKQWGGRAIFYRLLCVHLNTLQNTLKFCFPSAITEQNLKVNFKNMEERSRLAMLGQAMCSQISGSESAISLNYRAFPCWFHYAEMLKDLFLLVKLHLEGCFGRFVARRH